jgi:ABC-type uncharacterized transport system YnjBCD permease subunit
MRPFLSVTLIPALAGLALVLLPASRALPSVAETPLCQSYLSNAMASMQASQARLQSLRGKPGSDLCTLTRTQYLEAVKTRAVMAHCKSGPGRVQSVGELDATIEQLDDVIAARCAS